MTRYYLRSKSLPELSVYADNPRDAVKKGILVEPGTIVTVDDKRTILEQFKFTRSDYRKLNGYYTGGKPS